MQKEKNLKKKAKTKTKTKQKQNKTKTKMKKPPKNPTKNLPTDEQQQIVVLIL